MTKIICDLPKNLREDANLDNGLTIGSRSTRLNMRCMEQPSPDKVVLGSCPNPMPTKVFVDDTTGTLFIPQAEKPDCYFQIGPDLKTNATFGTRFEFWKGNVRMEFGIPEFTYIFRGTQKLSPEELEKLWEKTGNPRDGNLRMKDDLAGVILQSSRNDLSLALRYQAAFHWVEGGDKESAQYPKAFETLWDFRQDSGLEYGLRFQAIEWFFKEVSEKKAEAVETMLQLAKNPKEDSHNRYSTLSWLSREVPERKEEVIEAMLELGKDPKADSNNRYNILTQVVREVPERKEEVIEAMLELGKDPKADSYNRYNALTWVADKAPERKEEVIEAMLELGKDPKADSYNRYNALTWVADKAPERKEEVFEPIFQLAKDPKSGLDYRYVPIAWVVENTVNLDIKKQAIDLACAFLDNSVKVADLIKGTNLPPKEKIILADHAKWHFFLWSEKPLDNLIEYLERPQEGPKLVVEIQQ